MCWNIQKAGAAKVKRIAPHIVRTVRAALGNPTALDPMPTPVIGFLLEVAGSPDVVRRSRRHLRKAFERAGMPVDVKAISCGGEAHTAEHVIAFGFGMSYKLDRVDFGPYLEQAMTVDEDDARGFATARAKAAQEGSRRSSHKDQPLDHDYPRYLTLTRPLAAYRVPVRCTLRLDGREMTVVTMHSPGPAVLREAPLLKRAISEAIADQNPDVVIGDFNVSKEYPIGDMVDMGFSIDAGTTHKRKSDRTIDPLALSDTQYDRLYVSRPHRARALVITKQKVGEGEKPYTDHVLQHAEIEVGSSLVSRSKVISKLKGHQIPTAGGLKGLSTRSLQAKAMNVARKKAGLVQKSKGLFSDLSLLGEPDVESFGRSSHVFDDRELDELI